MNIIYMRHLLDRTNTRPEKPHLRKKVKKLVEIIKYASSKKVGVSSGLTPVCGKISSGNPCEGILQIILRPEPDLIHWKCPVCGDEALLTGWSGLIWDKSAKARYKKMSKEQFDDTYKGSGS